MAAHQRKKFRLRILKFFALRANPTSPTASGLENEHRAAHDQWVLGCPLAEGKNINFDVFLRLLAEFALAGLVGQVSGSPWLRGVPFFEALGLRRPPFLFYFGGLGASRGLRRPPFLVHFEGLGAPLGEFGAQSLQTLPSLS